MPTTYSWVISQLECYPQHASHTDVVFTVHWRRQATDGTHLADIYGSQGIAFDASSKFTPINEVTEDQVISWLENALGSDALEQQKKSLDAQIEAMNNPPSVSFTFTKTGLSRSV